MRIKIVQSKDLSVRDLRASTYAYSPKHAARELLDAWLKKYPGFLSHRSPAVTELRGMIEAELRKAMEK